MMPSPITWSSHFMMAGLLSRGDVPETAGLLTLHRGKVGITTGKLEFQCWTKNAGEKTPQATMHSSGAS